jgi:hypothetical protein
MRARTPHSFDLFLSCARAEIDAIYLNFWVAFWQFLLSFPLLVPSGYASGVSSCRTLD